MATEQQRSDAAKDEPEQAIEKPLLLRKFQDDPETLQRVLTQLKAAT